MKGKSLCAVLPGVFLALLAIGCDSTSSRGVAVTISASPARVAVLEHSDIEIQASPATRGDTAVIYYEVEFFFSRNETGATLIAAGSVTDGDGRARAIYKAGAKPGIDIVQVRLDDDVTASISIAVEDKQALTVALTAAPARVDPRGYSNLTAEFRQDGNPVAGHLVDFVITQNQSGGTLNAAVPTSDAAGRALAVYQAGSEPGVDMVQAIGQGGETASVIIVVGPEGLIRFSIVADPAAVTFFGYSNLTLTVTQNNVPLVGYQADFTFLQNQSGATLMTVSPFSDLQGQIKMLYQAGGTPGIDIIQAQGRQGEIASVGIFVGSAASATLALSAVPTNLNSGQFSDIQLQVRRGTQPVPDYRVTFTLVHNNSGGTLTTVDAVTNSQGNARAIYFTGNNSGVDVIRASGEDGQTASVGLIVTN